MQGNTVFVGGRFDSFANPGPRGSRARLAAFDTTTGERTAFNPTRPDEPTLDNDGVNELRFAGGALYVLYKGGRYGAYEYIRSYDPATGNAGSFSANIATINGSFYRSLDATSDRIYVAGSFGGYSDGSISQQPNLNVFYTSDRSALPAFSTGPNVGVFNGEVRLLGSTAYIGGPFTALSGNVGANGNRSYLAALDPSGATTPFNPAPDSTVYHITPAGQTMFVSGSFNNIGGQPRSGLAQLNPTTGAALGFHPAGFDQGRGYTALAADGDNRVYFGCDCSFGDGTSYLARYTDPVAPYLYVGTTGGVSPFTAPIGANLGALDAPADGGNEVWVAATPDGRTLYSTNNESQSESINVYRIDSSSGTLSLQSTAKGSGNNSIGRIDVSPDGRNLYASVQGAGRVDQFAINPTTGALTAQATYSFPVSNDSPRSVQVSPNGAYVIATGNNTAPVVYARDAATGNLTAIPQTAALQAINADEISYTADLSSVYITGRNNVIYQYNFAGGQLTPKSPAFVNVPGASVTISLAIDPGTPSKTVYAGDASTSNLAVFSIGADGLLTNVQDITTAGRAYDIDVSADGSRVFSTDNVNARVTQFTRAADGTLSGATQSATRNNPNGVVYVPQSAATAVRFRGGTVKALRRGVRISWKTGEEADVLGFDVLRKQGKRSVKVNRALIKGRALGVRRTSFSLVDPRGRTGSRYVLVERHTDGTKTTHLITNRRAAR